MNRKWHFDGTVGIYMQEAGEKQEVIARIMQVGKQWAVMLPNEGASTASAFRGDKETAMVCAEQLVAKIRNEGVR